MNVNKLLNECVLVSAIIVYHTILLKINLWVAC